jgi:hypothetical protein
MDEGGVDAPVIHSPGWDPNSTEMAFKAVRDFPGRFAILRCSSSVSSLLWEVSDDYADRRTGR